MKKYVKPSIEISALESKDIITTSRIVDNGQATYESEDGTIFSGQKGTFFSQFENIW